MATSTASTLHTDIAVASLAAGEFSLSPRTAGGKAFFAKHFSAMRDSGFSPLSVTIGRETMVQLINATDAAGLIVRFV